MKRRRNRERASAGDKEEQRARERERLSERSRGSVTHGIHAEIRSELNRICSVPVDSANAATMRELYLRLCVCICVLPTNILPPPPARPPRRHIFFLLARGLIPRLIARAEQTIFFFYYFVRVRIVCFVSIKSPAHVLPVGRQLEDPESNRVFHPLTSETRARGSGRKKKRKGRNRRVWKKSQRAQSGLERVGNIQRGSGRGRESALACELHVEDVQLLQSTRGWTDIQSPPRSRHLHDQRKYQIHERIMTINIDFSLSKLFRRNNAECVSIVCIKLRSRLAVRR